MEWPGCHGRRERQSDSTGGNSDSINNLGTFSAGLPKRSLDENNKMGERHYCDVVDHRLRLARARTDGVGLAAAMSSRNAMI